MTTTERATPPADYRLLLPEGWFRILLDPDQRTRSVDALVERQFRGIDNAPHLKEELRGDLYRRAAKAYRSGGIELYLSLQAVGPFTIPASLLVTLAPLRHAEPLPPEDLARVLAEDAGDGDDSAAVEISVEELPAGTAVRVRRRERQQGENGGDGEHASVSVEYHLPVPEATAYLLLTFSTPLEPIADAMAGLFDAVAGSLTWTE
ncbi:MULTISPECIES: hypothetical protein [Streptomyces]|uniref:DUF2867 domain-containing protein n=1 Tax=Streptomyces ardesiacus TaxID=285564 RepID=A0ABW8HJB8_9ACTN|nr:MULTISPECIES: hypothetical protein [Streptomyces]KOU02691.1 hypothetical protein ADK87_10385 [Streptomyces sp. NRRL F-4711]MCL7366314.1 hypothetical protein [Streptomyces ardesiacus]